jgi:hypothetical protein
MKNEKRGLLLLASGGMELSWLYAWATFTTAPLSHHLFPLPEVMGTFALAAALTIVTQGKGWRRIWIVGLQTAGFLLAALRVVYVFNYRSYPFFSQTWLKVLFSEPGSPLEWMLLLLLSLFWTLMFWVGGLRLVQRSTSYQTLCSRFDLGIAAFGGLFLIKLLLLRNGVSIHDPMTGLLIVPFFLFGLLSIGLVRNRTHAPKHYLSGYRGVGVIVSFAVLVLIFGAGLIFLCLPQLTVAAEVGYEMLKKGARPFTPILVSILRFLFMPRRSVPSNTESQNAELIPSIENRGRTGLLEHILGWGFGSLVGLFALILAGFGVWYVVRWLLSKTPANERKPNQKGLIILWIMRLRAMLLFCWEQVFRRVRGYRRAAQLYRALLDWGRYSGLPHRLTETPLEYGSRLKHHFPAVQHEIELIIEVFHQEVYGELILNTRQFTMAHQALQRLRSPLHWSSRLKSWVLQPGDKGNN